MYLYNEDKKRLRFETLTQNKIGRGEVYGDVYKLSNNTCLKVYKSVDSVNKDVLELLQKLDLEGFYKIYDFYYNRNGVFKAHTMEYYQKEEIDILTMPMIYTLHNISKLLPSVKTLTENNILVQDMHSDNAIITKEGVTVIDADLYTLNKFYSKLELDIKNLYSLEFLFRSLYGEALTKYHPECDTKEIRVYIRWLFNFVGHPSRDKTFKELEEYKYPIDYIKKRMR